MLRQDTTKALLPGQSFTVRDSEKNQTLRTTTKLVRGMSCAGDDYSEIQLHTFLDVARSLWIQVGR